jgi:hypothetical protein
MWRSHFIEVQRMSSNQSDADIQRQDLLETACEALFEGGFKKIKGLLEELDSPDTVEGFQPDLQGENTKGVVYYFVVETEVTLARLETAERIRALAVHAAEHGCQCVIIVPEGDEGVAGAVLEEHDIPEDNLDIWEG